MNFKMHVDDLNFYSSTNATYVERAYSYKRSKLFFIYLFDSGGVSP